jgi:hypothetical protein
MVREYNRINKITSDFAVSIGTDIIYRFANVSTVESARSVRYVAPYFMIDAYFME